MRRPCLIPDAYVRVARSPSVPPLLLGMVLNGISSGLPLAIILAAKEGGSFTVAGAAAAVFALGAAVSNPLRGRAVDRYGQLIVLAGLNGARVVVLMALAVAVGGSAPALTLILAAAAGLANPPVASSMRAMWRKLVADDDLNSAYALQSVLTECTYIAAPISVGALVVLIGGAGTLIFVAVVEALGTLVFLSSRTARTWREAPNTAGVLGALAAGGFRALALITLPIGMVFGVFDIAAPAVALDQSAEWVTGFASATLSIGSILGGLFYGARKWQAPPARRLLFLLALTALAFVPLGFVESVPALLVASAVAGLAISPTIATIFGLIDDVAPRGTGTEALTWILALYALGTALGAFVAGSIVSDNLQLVLGGPALLAAVAALLAAACGRLLQSGSERPLAGTGIDHSEAEAR